MMVSVAIFALIASIVFPAMIEFLSVRDRLEDKHKQLVGMQKTFLFLAKDLRFAVNRLSKDEYGEKGKATLSVNDDHLIEFTAQYPDLNLGGLNVPRRVRWQLNDGILQRVQYPVMDPDSDTRTLKQDLLVGVDDVEIELSLVEDGRDNTSEKWDEQTRLPDMVSVRVIMQNDIEYHRVFTMLAGDSIKALAASSSASGQRVTP
jgi:type II secretion system protein J